MVDTLNSLILFTAFVMCIFVETNSFLSTGTRVRYKIAYIFAKQSEDKVDIEIIRGQKILDDKLAKREMKKILKAGEKKSDENSINYLAPVNGKVFAKRSLFGQNIITCRDFNVEGKKSFDFIGGFKDLKSAPIYGVPEVCFIGRSNVGKSSLLNTLTNLNKKVAVESKTPGRTQSINMFKCSDNSGDLCIFVDLPGYGFAKMSRIQQEETARFLRAYLEERGPLKLAVLLIDVRRDIQDSDLGLCRKNI